jgi:hypothetical protein
MPLLLLAPTLTPHGRLTLVQDDDAAAVEAELHNGFRTRSPADRDTASSSLVRMKSEALFPRLCPTGGSLPHSM